MPWEWVAPAGTAAVGLAGIAATYFGAGRAAETAKDVSDRSAKTAKEVAERQAEAMLAAQREERHQRRLDAAYPALLDELNQGEGWIALTSEYRVGNGMTEPPTPPNVLWTMARQGQLGAVRSPRVANLVTECC